MMVLDVLDLTIEIVMRLCFISVVAGATILILKFAYFLWKSAERKSND